jgi:hypothetical protein
LPHQRQNGAGYEIPVFVDAERNDGLDVQDVLRAPVRAGVEFSRLQPFSAGVRIRRLLTFTLAIVVIATWSYRETLD